MLADSATMRSLSKGLIGVLLALALAALLALALAVQGAPQVAPRDDISPADVERAVAVAKLHDPRRAPPGQARRLALHEREVDLLAHQAAQRWLGANTRVQLLPQRLLVQASFAAPAGRWLNVELALREGAALPEVEHLRVGRLPLPAALAMPLLHALASHRGLQLDALLAADLVERVALTRGQMVLSYRLTPANTQLLRAALVRPADLQRLRVYTGHLAALTQSVAGDRVSLTRLLVPMLALAAERSAALGDAAAENRAALLTLTFFANHRPLAPLVPAALTWPQPRPLSLTLNQREDFALHFLISALIAAQADTPLAGAVGLWKELADARRGGSGFSFNDLAADRAGARFGELAVRDPARLHSRMAGEVSEGDFMPDTSDLPEGLPEAEFIARYGGVGGAGYKRMLAEIEARVQALAVLR